MCFVLSFSALALSVCFADGSPRVGAIGKPGQPFSNNITIPGNLQPPNMKDFVFP